ncbi:chondroitin proteoglycan-2-like [Orbicella faveolata]|uniref:chondroitin proteoglycan-2-like n=1 Tax=Orbicella faveolata TaxID=48498 RepID=UPI0009E19B12|nr:chondroitin proteoglycan-2-like [Orbicella faveolata]
MNSQLILATILLLFCSGVLSRVLAKRDSGFCESNSAGVHANPDDCHGFIMCDVAGNAHEMACPAGLKFNPAILVCDWPNNVECEDGFCESNSAGVHANPDDCHGFIMCDVAGNAHEMACPAGLKFNPAILVCDWPNNVECEDGSGEPAGY